MKGYTKDDKLDISKDKLNVLLVMLESTSRINSRRYLKKSRRYLEKQLGAIEMLGYHKVGHNTHPNMGSLLTGKQENEACFTQTLEMDKCPFIWKEYSKMGYITHLAEDVYRYSTRSKRQQEPTDYFDRPFYSALDESVSSVPKICLHGQRLQEVIFKRIRDIAEHMRNKQYFSLTMLHRGIHEYLEDLSNIDNSTFDLLKYLHNNNLLNNTILFLFGDHGMNKGRVRKTFIGQLEERLPMMFVYVPKWFRIKYKDNYSNLVQNARHLTSHFDAHATLRHILHLQSNGDTFKSKHGISLFSKIPFSRTCKEASILLYWCTCNYHSLHSNSKILNEKLAATFLNHLNSVLKKYRHVCAKLHLHSVVSSVQLLPRNEYILEHIVVIQTKPGTGKFEATIEQYNRNQTFVVVSDVDRLNRYGNQSRCVRNTLIKKLCFCK